MRNIKEAIADRTGDNIQSKVAPAVVEVGADRKTKLKLMVMMIIQEGISKNRRTYLQMADIADILCWWQLVDGLRMD
jgi:hypothetical protein